MIVEAAIDGTRHEVHIENMIETSNREEQPADKVNLDGDIDASKYNGKEENAINEGCTEDNMTVEAREKVAAEVRNEEKGALNLQHDKEESATVEDVQKNGEATSALELNVGEVLAVSMSDFKDCGVMENMTNQDLVEVKGFLEFPGDALIVNEKEESNDDDVNTADEVQIAPKKKVKKSKKIAKKKIVKRKAMVAEDETKSQLVEMHKPIAEVRTNENVETEENLDANPENKVNKSRRVRKKKKKNVQQSSEIIATNSEAEPDPSENDKSAGKEEVANENVNHKEEVKSDSRVKKLRKRKRNGKEAAKGNAGEASTEDKHKAEPSREHKSSKKVDTMGMIFMCSSKTKRDCFHYKIFGLPASKKDMVLKIYEGMRLFLFDVESRLLYGIYKAAGPGGYNIEPKAFNSDFPSQVRITVLDERVPLPEEKFKEVIKDNYFTKNKFDCQLNADQVKQLCKLFVATKKASKSDGKIPRAGTLGISEQQKKRKRAEDVADPKRKKKRAPGDAKQDRKNKRAQGVAMQDRKNKRAQDYARRDREKRSIKRDGRRSPYRRHSPHIVSIRNPQPAVIYERDPYVPEAIPAFSYVALPPAVPAYTSSYTYGRSSGVDAYRRDTAVEREDRRLAYTGLEYLDKGRSDHYRYSLYSEPVIYRDSQYQTSARADYYSTAAPRDITRQDYYSSAASRDGTRQDYYRSELSQDEYLPSSSSTAYSQVPLPPFRRY